MDIKIFVCCHQPAEIPQHPLLVPLQVGAALSGTHFSGFLHDDTGDNISRKNRSYCELTGQYWVWKNVEADYYGFFHYRRYLYPEQTAKRPYRIEARPSQKTLDRLHFSDLEALIPRYDLIVPRGEDMRISVREHYASALFHHCRDLDLAKEILLERHPDCGRAAETYLRGSVNYFGNIFTMRKQVFQDYCDWLFPILEEFDRQVDISGYSARERRVDGYLAERLLGIYVHEHQSLRMLELPKVHFVEDTKERIKRQAINFFLPPGSVRRSRIKAMKR